MPDPYFLNVDLDIESAEDLTALVRALEPRVDPLARPDGSVSLELAGVVRDPDAAVRELCRLIAALPPPLRGLWDRATRRAFDIGFTSARTPASATYALDLATLRAVVDVGAEIAITLYPLTGA